MCVAIPGRIISVGEEHGPSRRGMVVFTDGKPRQIDLALVPEATVGDYVVTHSGFAISRVSEQSAMESYRLWEQVQQD